MKGRTMPHLVRLTMTRDVRSGMLYEHYLSMQAPLGRFDKA
jgi:hypothetical protein